MTLHNLPEGFAVAFAAFTDFGPVMTLAIAARAAPNHPNPPKPATSSHKPPHPATNPPQNAAQVHNIPEGVIVAAPIYAATGSRWKALGAAAASGLSEPVGAAAALLLVKPWLNEARLQYMLAAVGGIMTAVCVVELLPEGRKCKQDAQARGGGSRGVRCSARGARRGEGEWCL